MKPANYSRAAVEAHPAPSREGRDAEAYAMACKATHEARVAFDAPKLTTGQKLDAIGIEAICERVADCVTLQTISNDVGISKGSLITWLAGYADQYARAREAQAEVFAEDILAIADDGLNDTYTDGDGNIRTDQDVVARSRLRIDARKWLAGKMSPKKYGDKVTQEVVGKDGGPVEVKTTVAFESDALSMLEKIKGDK